MLIKRTKLSEKVSPLSADSPPELSRSLPTSDSLSDTLTRGRSLSVESGYSLDQYDMDGEDVYPEIHHSHLHHPHHFTPFEVDIMTEKQTYINGFAMPMRRNSTSTDSYTSSMRRDSTVASTGFSTEAFQLETGTSQHVHLNSTENGHPAAADFNFFDFNNYQPEAQPELSYVPADENDQRLLDHFVENVLPILFPILDLNLDGAVRRDVILPALANNECYRSCCLSIAALHLKATQGLQGEWIDQDITRHRYATISGLCQALEKDTDHLQILEATIGMILFQCSVGTSDDSLPDIPWHQHFQAVASLVNKLDLPRFLQPLSQSIHPPPSVNMTLTAWIDILGATMIGRAPQFADTYREKHLSNGQSGLREMMGCDDRVMYLISEIACLEALKNDGMLSDMELCDHVKSLAYQIDLTEPSIEQQMAMSQLPIVSASGHLDTRQLTRATTDAFRYAARIYLCSLVPGFDPQQPQVMELLNKLTYCLESIPAGPDGFDRSLVWVLLIGGSVATPGSLFKGFFESRCDALGDAARYGSFGRMQKILDVLWERRDSGLETTWREVMESNQWDFLLI